MNASKSMQSINTNITPTKQTNEGTRRDKSSYHVTVSLGEYSAKA